MVTQIFKLDLKKWEYYTSLWLIFCDIVISKLIVIGISRVHCFWYGWIVIYWHQEMVDARSTNGTIRVANYLIIMYWHSEYAMFQYHVPFETSIWVICNYSISCYHSCYLGLAHLRQEINFTFNLVISCIYKILKLELSSGVSRKYWSRQEFAKN